MKKIVILLSAVIIFGCNNSKIDRLNQEKDSIAREALKRDSTINNLFWSFNKIEENLDSIKVKENIISVSTKGGPEMQQDVRDRINNDIQLINDLMDKNKKLIASLYRKIDKYNLKIAEFEKMISKLQKQLKEKDAEIEALKQKLLNLNFEIETLNAHIDTLEDQNEQQAQVIVSKDKEIGNKVKELNTAYYVIGTEKELKEHQVITKQGGFVGIGKIEKLMDDFNKDYFTKIDITELKQISVYSKKARLLTTHPSSAYKFESKDGKIEKLTITNAEDFWRASKYLVIIIE